MAIDKNQPLEIHIRDRAKYKTKMADKVDQFATLSIQVN